MPIKDSHEGLPKGRAPRSDPGPGRPPSLHLLPDVLTAWEVDRDAAEGEGRPMSIEGRAYRASWASLRCDRQLQYAMTDVPRSDPFDVASKWRMSDGTYIHETLGPYFAKLKGVKKVELERAVDLRAFDLDGAASADVVITWRKQSPTGAKRTVVEMKSIGGYQFKKRASPFDGPPEGPQQDHVIQGCLAAAALAASDDVETDACIAYVAIENLSVDVAARYGLSTFQRFLGEYWSSSEDASFIAESEAMRVEELAQLKGLTPRLMHDDELPPGSIVTNPVTKRVDLIVAGSVVASNKTWRCGYCGWRDRCVEDGP